MKSPSNIITVISFLILAACGENPSQNEVMREDSLVKLEYLSIETSQFREILSLNGTAQIAPSKISYINIPLGGRISQFNKINGENIIQGERICYFENHQYLEIQKSYLSLINEYKFEKTNFERLNQLTVGQSVSKREIEEFEYKIKTTELQLKATERELEFIGLNPKSIKPETLSSKIPYVAPFSGKISQIQCKNGMVLTPESNAFVLVGPSDIITLNAYSKDLNKVQIGQDVEINSFDQREIKTQGEILAIDPMLNSNGVFTISVKLNHSKFTNGQPILGIIKSQSVKCFRLPIKSIVEYQGKYYIVVRNNLSLKNLEIQWLGQDEEFGYFNLPEMEMSIKKAIKSNVYGWFMKNLNN
jgi:cobalt-zinc-cadmium efflux system membrane fusion protein